jgi:hypothetical protein
MCACEIISLKIRWQSYDVPLGMAGFLLTFTTDFISQFVRAANRTDAWHPLEVKRLLDKSIATIEELRIQSGIFPIRGRDAIIYIRTVAAGAESVGYEEWHHALLHAAELIRDLRVVLDKGTQIKISVKPP